MHVPALERVVEAFLVGAVVQDAGVLELRVVAEQRFDEQLFGPPHAVPHRAHDGVLADHDPGVTREEEIGQRWQCVGHFIQRASDRPAVLERALDHQGDEVFRRQRGQLLRQHVRRHHLERARRNELAHFRPARDFDQGVAHLVHFREPLQHRDQPPMLALRDLEVDDVVVEVFLSGAGGDRHQLFAGRVHQNGTERADL